MINFYFANVAKAVFAFFLAISQSAVKPAAPEAALLRAGDSIDGMTLSQGAGEARPLWAFCSNSPEGKGSYILDCRAPALPALGIGNIFLHTDEGITNLDWSDLVWELSIDAQDVDLESFGTFDYVRPSLSKNPSPVREVFKRGTAWDIVLTDLTPGHHTLWFVAQSKIESYTWFVNLDIEAVDGMDYGSIPFPLHS